MEKLHAKHEIPVINVASGINLHVKLHQAFFFLMVPNFVMFGEHLKTF